tara:strand:+ start:473 stop:592 length:120 start_codon:yes stop_codon:yes gene_type:complete
MGSYLSKLQRVNEQVHYLHFDGETPGLIAVDARAEVPLT